jgi:hypothetical protein
MRRIKRIIDKKLLIPSDKHSKIDQDKEEFASILRGSLLEFTKYFTKYITGRDFIIAQPLGQEPSQITLCRSLTSIFRMEDPGYNHSFHIAPGTGKTLQMCMFVAWTYTHYPDCNYLYISNAKDLATSATAFIKQIMTSEMYTWLFDVHISRDSRAKEHFATTAGGNVAAFGSDGGITGRNSGLPITVRWSGCTIYDDAEKPKTIHSDTIRGEIQRNYRETIAPRPRSPVVPTLYIGQRLHEDDLAAYFINGKDVRKWKITLLPSEDSHHNPLHPHLYSAQYLADLREKSEYVYWSQHMQQPLPSGGSLFKPEWIVQLDQMPEIQVSFITCDTAETSLAWNDATVFSFWGVYEIEYEGRKTGDIGLHWLDTVELRIEPKDLKDEFLDFWGECHRFKVPPTIACIEKKSTGVTLLSVLRDLRGITIRDIKRDRSSGSKGDRFVECQAPVGHRLLSISSNAKHKELVLDHISKITANGSHRHDDICFVAGSKIATTRGYVNIENITIKDKIITPLGIASVSHCGSTGFHKVIKNINLEGTPNHPIFYEDKFIPLTSVADIIRLDKLSFLGLLKWKQRQLLFLMEKNLDLRLRQDILRLSKENIETNFFIALYGSFIQKKKYRKGLLFIIKTITNLITVLRTWSVFQLSNIVLYISKASRRMSIVKRFWKECEQTLKNTFSQKREKQDSEKSPKEFLTQTNQPHAVFVESLLLESGITHIYAPQNVNAFGQTNGIESGTPKDQSLMSFANIAKQYFRQKICHRKNTTQKHAPKSAQEDTDIKEVYNLTIEDYGVYYANGILVSNCDTMADAINIALIEKTISINTKVDAAEQQKMLNLRQAMLKRHNAR